jgi:toxin ParE1/3/4
MPARLPLRYLPSAQEDLLGIIEFIANDSPSRAVTFTDALNHHIRQLSRHPRLGRLPRHPHLASQGYRVLIVEEYLVLYLLRPSWIEIHRVVHSSRDLDHLF